jgi:hypothetical protein
MKIFNVVAFAASAAFAVSGVNADESGALIKLDKAWGGAQSPGEVESLITSKFVAVDEDGVSGRSDLLKAMANDDAPVGPYVAGNYKVEFLDSNTAVMTHSAGSGDDKHWSMHLWRKNGGKWQVAATASVEADD